MEEEEDRNGQLEKRDGRAEEDRSGQFERRDGGEEDIFALVVWHLFSKLVKSVKYTRVKYDCVYLNKSSISILIFVGVCCVQIH